ncbi:site-specific DNA-methyltransferase [Winogradskyella poriferorum]|uniref:site-specific DNA-methyltransferase n=1 Tax=Winogradskyella poriferorum TaxID=307627 RepID=UPI003D647C66
MSIEKINKGDNLSQSENIVESNIDKLKALFPEIVTEGKIDFKVLQEVLGEEVEQGEEYYRFTWAGKANARREAQKPSTGTLRPAPEESVDWDTTQNLYIEGDNLEVLKLLQKSYAGKVKMIYIDPPYNTGKDFVYKDNYKDNLRNYQEVTGQLDEEGNKLSTNSDSDGRYHSNWLNMIYPRLRLARNLLKDDGVIFMSIDDNEVENLRKVCNELFGEENFVANVIWQKKYAPQNDAKWFTDNHDHILLYAKSKSKYDLIPLPRTQKQNKYYINDDNDGRGLWRTDNILVKSYTANRVFPIINPNTKEEFLPPKGRCWRYSKDTIDRMLVENRLYFGKDGDGAPQVKRYLSEVKQGVTPLTLWLREEVGDNQEGKNELNSLFDIPTFDTPKVVRLIKRMLHLSTKENDIVLDFFSGSGTTAHAVMQLNSEDGGNRTHIQIQLPETTDEKSEVYKAGYKTIAEIGKERIRRAATKIKEEHPDKAKKLDLGFKVFKLDTSNIKAWDGNPANLDNSLFDAQDNIKTYRTEHDVLYEILLKFGLDLTLPIEEKQIESKTVFSVGYGALFICLGDNLNSNIAEGIGKWKEELQPEVCRVVFKDSGFTDVEKTNSVQILKRFGITEIKSI